MLWKAPAVPSESPRANIGEWSELYTLAFLLVHGGAFAADENQDAIPSMFHRVIQVHLAQRRESMSMSYRIEPAEIVIMRGNEEVGHVERSKIELALEQMLAQLTDGSHQRTFELSTGNHLLELLQKYEVSASSVEHENDLELVLEDQATRVPTPRVGFSIKSQLGGRSTLLNASRATNFIFQVIPNDPQILSPYPQFEHGRHRRNLNALFEAGYHLEFRSLANERFYQNLILLDMQFPNYLAKVLLHAYTTGEDAFATAVNQVFPPDNRSSRQPVFKLKEFLGAVAMGLRPSTDWDGDTTKFRGILVVKPDGEVVFYYLYNRKNFEEYLFRNVAFERASTTRHGYGSIYSENGIDLMKLNLQVRFSS